METIENQIYELSMKLIQTDLIRKLKTNQPCQYHVTEYSKKLDKVSYTVRGLRAVIENELVKFNDADCMLHESDYLLKGFLYESIRDMEVITSSIVVIRIHFTNGDYIVIEEVAVDE